MCIKSVDIPTCPKCAAEAEEIDTGIELCAIARARLNDDRCKRCSSVTKVKRRREYECRPCYDEAIRKKAEERIAKAQRDKEAKENKPPSKYSTFEGPFS